jgi:hypothetical protein
MNYVAIIFVLQTGGIVPPSGEAPEGNSTPDKQGPLMPRTSNWAPVKCGSKAVDDRE